MLFWGRALVLKHVSLYCLRQDQRVLVTSNRIFFIPRIFVLRWGAFGENLSSKQTGDSCMGNTFGEGYQGNTQMRTSPKAWPAGFRGGGACVRIQLHGKLTTQYLILRMDA